MYTCTQSLEAAVSQFMTIVEKKDLMVPFPPAFYGLGKALAKLHRHGDALDKAREGLKLLRNYHLPVSLTWPGTNEVLTEALAQNVEVRESSLQEAVTPIKDQKFYLLNFRLLPAFQHCTRKTREPGRTYYVSDVAGGTDLTWFHLN